MRTASCPKRPTSSGTAPPRWWPANWVACAACCLGVGWPALAQDAATREDFRRWYVEAGVARGGTWTASLGLNLPWTFERALFDGQLTGHWDAYISQWSARNATPAGVREAWTQLALVPTLRFRFDQGRSPWFIEGGIGLSVLDSRYQTRRKTFSTQFNFADHQALGWSFGERRQHEVLLILRHASNAGIKKPNPGENFLQVRYSKVF